MSAAATAAGYLYASGRLERMRQVRQERRDGIRVPPAEQICQSVLDSQDELARTVKITYRKRRLP